MTLYRRTGRRPTSRLGRFPRRRRTRRGLYRLPSDVGKVSGIRPYGIGRLRRTIATRKKSTALRRGLLNEKLRGVEEERRVTGDRVRVRVESGVRFVRRKFKLPSGMGQLRYPRLYSEEAIMSAVIPHGIRSML